MGRKPIRAELKRNNRLVVMMTPSEMKTLEDAAEQSGAESLSAWVRQVLFEAVENGTN